MASNRKKPRWAKRKTRRVFRKVLEGWGLHQEVENTGNGRRLQMDKK